MKQTQSVVKEASSVYGIKILSRKLSVRPSTIKNWGNGDAKPNKKHLDQLNRLIQPWLKEAMSQPGIKDLKVLSLFSGCGGMDLGFEGNFDVLSECINPMVQPEWLPLEHRSHWVRLPSTRFKTIFANDIRRAAKAAWVPFFGDRYANEKYYHLESIVDLVKKCWSGDYFFPDADVITGGFPCQDFSVAGKRAGFNSKKAHHGNDIIQGGNLTEENRGNLYIWMRHVIDIVRPKVFIAENVKGLVSLKNVKEIIENDFRNIGSGYSVVNAKVLYAPDYGVPQTRERVIFIGFRNDALKKSALEALSEGNVPEDFDPYPAKTHALVGTDKLIPHVAVKHCFKGLLEPSESIDPSQRIYSKAKWYGKHCQGQTEVVLDKPGPTIRSEHHGNIEFRRLSRVHGGKHFAELEEGLKERRLTVRECARIQTFPDAFEFIREGNKLGSEYKISGSDSYKIIGNAVPPLLAAHIAWRLQELWPKIMRER